MRCSYVEYAQRLKQKAAFTLKRFLLEGEVKLSEEDDGKAQRKEAEKKKLDRFKLAKPCRAAPLNDLVRMPREHTCTHGRVHASLAN